jgi:7,8-dihydropterin-6-yl-methyl-4-(beta-D-ribofuranosyl)aminobenzene 5'-phosphate synthase
MAREIKRREVLKTSAAFAAAAAAGGFSCIGIARAAAPIDVPTVDGLTMHVLVDSASDLFFKPQEAAGVKTEPGRSADSKRPLHSEWGLSLLVESRRGDGTHTFIHDYGWTSAINNNIELLRVDPGKIDSMILSHGHFDHWGGLMPFLDKHRDAMHPDMTIYAGGEDNFCHRYNRAGAGGDLADYGVLDRRDIAAHKVKLVLCESPVVIGGHAFTTGQIKRQSIERVLPNSMVEFAMKDGVGCNASHYLPAEMEGKIVPDEHIHEHALCFNVRGKGLVVLSSCGHVGIVNTVRQAMAVSGIDKVHAIVGGFHLGPAPADYLTQVVAEIGKLNPDVLIPMHCSGLNFTLEAQKQLPGKVLTSTTGARITFGA